MKTFSEFKKEELEQSISSRFEQKVNQYPHSEAIKTYDHHFTYEQLNKAANRLAHLILAQRGEGEELVSILFEHGTSMLVAMLGILKAGKSWVPIDPFYPNNRISFILEDSQASLLITNSQNLSLAHQAVANQKQCQVLNIDEIDDRVNDENLELSISPDTIACVIYTSGSTGQPKGVVHNHRNLLHLCMRWTNSLSICPEDRLVLISSYCHIGGVSNIFRALLNGAVSLPFNLKEKDFEDLVNWLVMEQVTLYHSVTTVFRHLIDTLKGNEDWTRLRVIYLGGESVFKRDIELYKKHFDDNCIFVNNLGCTEISGYRQYFINKSTQITGNIVPAGYAVEDTEIVLLNDKGQEVDPNCVGEIAVKSHYLALGYWQRPDLTAKAFLSSSAGGKERLYRTGDKGKLLADNCLIPLGRIDFQVQIRGYRVEIGEIEAMLMNHPQLKEAAVRDWDNDRGEKYLLAYVVPYSKQVVKSSDLRGFLQQSLPDYMIPTAFVFLDALPLNPNGKIDRKALPKQDRELLINHKYIAPRTPNESIVANIFLEILKLEKVGIYDNFFELGGNSLLAVILFSQISNKIGVSLPLSTILKAANIKELAREIELENTSDFSCLVPIQEQGTKPPFFCVHGGHGEVICFKDLASNLGLEQPFYALRAKVKNGEIPPFTSIEAMAKLYLKEIKKVQPQGPYFIGGYCFGGLVAFEMAKQLREQGEEISLLALLETYAPHSLKPLPLQSKMLKHWRNFSSSGSSYILSRLKNNYLKYFTKHSTIINKKHNFLVEQFPNYTEKDVAFWNSLHQLHKQASLSYNLSVYSGKITVFRAKNDPIIKFFEPIIQCGWSEFSSHEIELYDCQGGHSSFLKEPHVQSLARQLELCISIGN